jgi:hypothetical protein
MQHLAPHRHFAGLAGTFLSDIAYGFPLHFELWRLPASRIAGLTPLRRSFRRHTLARSRLAAQDADKPRAVGPARIWCNARNAASHAPILPGDAGAVSPSEAALSGK